MIFDGCGNDTNKITSKVSKFFDAEFFPIDSRGSGLVEGQRDCQGLFHNFGFTTVIHTGMMFKGSGSISVAGGDELWVYINKILVVELIAQAEDPDIPCRVLHLTPAAIPGGSYLTQYGGVMSEGRCDNITLTDDDPVFLQLVVGNTYHFDLFHAERKGCKSTLFLETKSIQFVQNNTFDEPPVDYFVFVDEDFHVDGILAELTLVDWYSNGPEFVITIIRGNEAGHFTLKTNTTQNRLSAISPPDVVYNYTTVAGIDTAFVECKDQAVLVEDGHNEKNETFILHDDMALFTLNTSLDFEVTQTYLIVMEVTDTGLTPTATGNIVVKVFVRDVNDNCPTLNETSFSFESIPALHTEPVLGLPTEDRDSSHNGNVTYLVSEPDVSPPLSRYNTSFDLYYIVYNETSEITFSVLAVDGGEPRRGILTTVRLTLSNTCLLNALFERIETRLEIDSATGNVWFRIPKYWVYAFDCQRPTGLSTGFVLDYQITASSYEYYSYPGRGRVNETYDPISWFSGGWVSETFDANQWLQVDLTEPYKFQKVILQGREDEAMWVTKYTVSYSNNGLNYTQYTDANGTRIFDGASSQDEAVSQDLRPAILAQFVRIHPQAWHGGISLRLDFVGCSQAEQKYYDTSCQRCDPGHYCPGDGQKYPCGRCESADELETCTRSPTEHSFGAQAECSVCPKGWLCSDGRGYPCPPYHYTQCNTSYCPETCTQCEPGYACRGGTRYLCTPGTYSDGYLQFCALCSPGTYQNASGASQCLDCDPGFISSKMKDRCTACPKVTWSNGNGEMCSVCGGTECRCQQNPFPCFKLSACYNTRSDGISYACGSCPSGFQGDGITCTDIDECLLYDPCWNGTICINTAPGYQCTRCPRGYTGNFKDAASVDVNVRVYTVCGRTDLTVEQQTCHDVDECLSQNGACDINSYCYNTIGSYTCGHCKKGFLGDAIYGCFTDNLCAIGKHNCSEFANCLYTGPSQFRCECYEGYAGNGQVCGEDSDFDGYPDLKLLCPDKECLQDNCLGVPNSDQEDTDHDTVGDACDEDDDNDVIPDNKDNCQFVVNYDQADFDDDRVGDTCDNCPDVYNPDQRDSDNDDTGDECDTDDDNDGIQDDLDNCPLVPNAAQEDSDNDGRGDACDNCRTIANYDQTDTDQNGYGDACDEIGASDKDKDGDGVIDIYDNCEGTINPDQSDIDGDGIGDACDNDKDGDGILNDVDNCPYVNNPDQADSDGNQIGDVCQLDSDGDGLINSADQCPYINSITLTNFTLFTVVNLNPLANATAPDWKMARDGRHVQQLAGIESPLMLIGAQRYSSIDYSGTVYVNTNEGCDFIGFVFGYQNNRKFYLVTWKRNSTNYGGSDYRAGIRGVEIKVVNSVSGPGPEMANALWHSADTANETRVLWHDPSLTRWLHQTAYRWRLQWRPSLGLIRLRITRGITTVIDSGDIYDITISGGGVGLFVFNQTSTIWSDLLVRCVDKENLAIEFRGESVFVGNITDLGLEESFTLEAFVFWEDAVPSGVQPVLCTLARQLCMFIEDGIFSGTVGNTTIQGKRPLTGGDWHHLFMRYEAETYTLSLYINGTSTGADAFSDDVISLDYNNEATDIFLARDEIHFFNGVIDEVRIYNIWLTDSELDSRIGSASSKWDAYQRHLSIHYPMNDDSSTKFVTDRGPYKRHGQANGTMTYVQSASHRTRFQISEPDNK